MKDELLHANRELWNTWAKVNFASELYDVEGFVAGDDRVKEPGLRLLYPYFHGPELASRPPG